MKTISAKDFQRNHASVIKEVANGHEYEVTYHRKPLIKLIPISNVAKQKIEPGSRAAILNSLNHTFSSKGDLFNLPYKHLRGRLLQNRHGK